MIPSYHARYVNGKTGDLKKAYKKRDHRVKIRMAAVDTVRINDEGIWHAADPPIQCSDLVSM